jgi:hypothetical protein
MDVAFLTTLHSHNRHLVFLTAAIAILLALVALIRKRPLGAPARWAARTYSLVLTLQFLVGLIVLIGRWDDFADGLRHRLEHAVIMLVAVGLTHITGRFAKLPPPVATRNTLLTLLASLILVVLGIWILPQGAAILGLAR